MSAPTGVVLARAALVGAVAGLASALADAASTVLWLAPGPDRARLVAVLCAAGLAVGALVALAAAALDRLLARWQTPAIARHAALVAAPLGLVARKLFEGGTMRRLPARPLLVALTALLLVAVASVALTRLRALAAALPSWPRWRRRAVGVAAVAAGLALHGLDHRVLPRLYEYLHAGLGALTALAFALAAVALAPAPWWLSRAQRRHGLVAAALAAACGAWAWGALDRWPNVRAEVFGAHAPFVRHVALAVAGAVGAPEARPLDAMALRRARLAREQSLAHRDTAAGPSMPGAHVLLVTVDAMRADRLGRGGPARSLTPTLDGLAARGVVFERAYAQAPHSSYSLSSLHTGEYLHETLPLGQPQPLATLADAMRARGRHTAALYTRGVFFTEAERLTAYRDADFGFARASHVDRDADAQAEAAMAEIDDVVRRGEPPSLLWVHFFDAHAPYQGRGATTGARYDDAVTRIDAALGRLLAHASRRLARDVVVAVTADHGEEFGEHGGVYHGSALYEEQVRVPLVVAAPGLAPQRVWTPVELVDVAPTLLGLVGIPRAPTMRGRDLRGWMVAPPPPEDHAAVFSAVNTRKMARRGRWKLVSDLTYGVDELYDLATDPGERRNLAATRPLERDALRADLGAWLEALADRGAGRGPIARARLGDRGAAPGLVALAHDPRTPERDRVEAVELLAGLADASHVEPLRPLLRDPSARVRTAAAVALGAAGDASAAPVLRDLVTADPPSLRRRAARALARLGDPAALDPLVEALWSSDEAEALEAIKALGALGDARALEPLMTVFPDDHLRYRVVLALGQLRDARLFETLARTALTDPTEDARANAVAALGMLGDRRAVPLLAATLGHARAERYAAEALCALGVVGPRLDGFDPRLAEVVPEGFDACGPHEDTLGWRYLGAQSCVGKPARGRLALSFLSRGAGRRLVVVRARRDDGAPLRVPLRLNGAVAAVVTLTARWDESRFVADLPAGDVTLAFDLAGVADPPRIHVGHVLSLPAR